MQILRLAVPTPLRRLFDYLPPDDCNPSELTPGIRVSINFGRRELTGILLEVTDQTDVPVGKLKPAKAILDEVPPLPEHILELGCWAADYYQHPIGDALAQTYPVALRKGADCSYQHQFLWRATGPGKSAELKANAHKQREALETLLRHPKGISSDALKAESISSTTLKALADKGFAEQVEHLPEPHWPQADELIKEPSLQLNSQQSHALQSINQDGFSPFLLHGITGSGKTEVYLQAIEQQLQQQRQALVLVPEIGLTPQTVARFRQRFNVTIQVLHSNMTDRQRLDAWLQARDGIAQIIIGTRSAIFTPLGAPGIIIVDEEHDSSFKQQEGFRYSARDLAVMRARAENIPVILGTATPSLETLHNAWSGRYKYLQLTERAGKAAEPDFQLLDIKQQPLTDGLSDKLIGSISRHLEQQKQVLIFLNRRGFSPSLMCHSCGEVVDCRRCDAHMTLHRKPAHLHCHHCDTQSAIPDHCPRCNSRELQPVGTGTERAEERLRQLFPGTPVIRVDRDSTQRKNAMKEIMDQINTGEPCILIGTQMLAKGHHFPNVTLVAILDADGGLFSADFRGMERTAQMILQVAGRAGRADHKGTVLMQTFHSDHPAIQTLVEQGYTEFAKTELSNRKSNQLPPYTHYALVRAEATVPGRAEAVLQTLRQQLQNSLSLPFQVSWLGPFPSAMEKRAGMFRAQMALQCTDRRSLHLTLDQLCQTLEHSPEARKIRWSIDVDPADSY